MTSNFHESARKIIQDDLPNVRKSLIIGLGGSGMKGINSAKKYIESQMPREARLYMRWIGVDTTDIGTSIEGQGGRYRFPGEKQFYQEEERTLYIASPTPDELSIPYMRKIREQKAYKWFPDPDVYTISTRAGQGANQTRPLGRLAFFHNYEKIRNALIKERDRLIDLSNDPKYFKLMDLQEKSKIETTDTSFIPDGKGGKYYIDKDIPDNHDIIGLAMDGNTQSLLCPHIPKDKIKPSIFPKDNKGYYVELPPGSNIRSMKFTLRHAPREATISIFLTGSVVGGTGNGMFLDFAALVRDIFRDTWPQPKIYGIVVLPSAFKRVVYNRNARANAYAALKEIDYFMSGNTFNAHYPGGYETQIKDRLFDDGMLYLMDVENQSGNVLQDRDQVQELTGQFIYTFVASNAGGAIEERMVNDSSRASIYIPHEESKEPRRRASYNSFGISRVTYPAPMMRDIGFKLVSLRLIQNFRKRYKPQLLEDSFGDLNRGLVRALRLNCLLIFKRMYPDYKLDWKNEFNSYRQRIKKAISKEDTRSLSAALDLMHRDYGKGEADKLKERMLTRMEIRWRIELDKIEQVMHKAIKLVLKDPSRGFLFCRALLEMVMDRLELYEDTYYQNRVGLEYYNDDEITRLISDIDNGEFSQKKAEAVYSMIRLNHLQLIYESMLESSETFIREFKGMLYKIKNDIVVTLEDKLTTLDRQLQAEIQEGYFELLQKINPLYFYLITKKEIQNFINSYFAKRLSVDDLSNDVEFLEMDKGDDSRQLIETWLIGQYGLEILEKDHKELDEFIYQELGPEILEMEPEKVKERLFGDGGEMGLDISDSTMNRIEVENLRIGLYRVIQERFAGFNFENISISKLLEERNIPIKKILTRLDNYSQPYITADLRGMKSMEYYRTITDFELNVFEEGDIAPDNNKNDLPPRMDHYRKRETMQPNISVETFMIPNLCKPYEMISIGLVLGFPIYKVEGLNQSAEDYHHILKDRSHPMHLFNDPGFDARYFPDPFRHRNYLNPKHLWNGLVEYGLLKRNQGDTAWVYVDSIQKGMKELEAKEQYFSRIRPVIDMVNDAGGIKKCNSRDYIKSMVSLGMLKKDDSNKYMFRQDFDLVIRDILDGDGTGNRANDLGLGKDEYIKQNIPSPEFEDLGKLSGFLEENPSVRSFLNKDMERIFNSSQGNVNAGAAVPIPQSRINETSLPVFKDETDFYDYFEERGSLEWQNYLKHRLVEVIQEIVRKFRHPDDPTLPDRGRINKYLDEQKDKIPFLIVWEIKVNNGIIK